MIPKFRGKSIADENKGEWMCGNLITDKTSAYITDGDIDAYEDFISIERWCSIDVNTVGQSTGLFDKNGVEVFEGDIVKTTRFFGRADEVGGFYEYDKELIGIVKVLEGAWVIDIGNDAVHLWTEVEENEVIGNIYENPEYLKKRGN